MARARSSLVSVDKVSQHRAHSETMFVPVCIADVPIRSKRRTNARFFFLADTIAIADMAPKPNIHERTYIMVKVSLSSLRARVRLAHVPNSPTASTAVSSARSSPDSRNAASKSSPQNSPSPPKTTSKAVRVPLLPIHPSPPYITPTDYADLKEKPFFPGLITYMQSGPVFCIVFEGLDAVKTGRAMLGATNPLASQPGASHPPVFATRVGSLNVVGCHRNNSW